MKPIKITTIDHNLIIELAGDWQLMPIYRCVQLIKKSLAKQPTIQQISFDAQPLTYWDSTLIVVLQGVQKLASEAGITIDWRSLPPGIKQLLVLAETHQVVEETPPQEEKRIVGLSAMGQYSLDFINYILLLLNFIGRIVKSAMRFATGNATFSYREFINTFYYAGPKAVPAISVIGFMLGSALAFGGLKPLQLLGQELLVANVIGYGVVRQAAPLFTAIFLLVRVGAGMTGDISLMQTQHQIDAFRVNLISPMDYLVLPRLFAIMIAAPLLCLYVDLVGVLGGWLTSIWYFEINASRLQTELIASLHPTDLFVGISKCLILSIIVVVIGCQRGLSYLQNKKNTITETVAGTLMIGLIALFLANVLLDYLFAQLGL